MNQSKKQVICLCLVSVLLAVPAGAQGPAGITYDAGSYGTVSADPSDPDGLWMQPGAGGALPATGDYLNHYGMVGMVNQSGQIQTEGHPFFDVLGINGRGCVSCHQPSQAMSLAAANIRSRWDDSQGRDPLFAANDGSDCPVLPQSDARSHGLVLDRGVFRVALAWPPRAASGKPIRPDFTISVVHDPNSCNSGEYGPQAPTPGLSVYRRPRMVANFPQQPGGCGANTPMPILMADGRAATLKAQAIDAAMTHLQMPLPPNAGQLDAIAAFECQVYVAQSFDMRGWALGQQAGPPGLGPQSMALAAQSASTLKSVGAGMPVFQSFAAWKGSPDAGEQEFRQSVARGAKIFTDRRFGISGAAGINPSAAAIRGTCASCHDITMSGMASSRWIDTGSTNQPWAISSPDLPLFRITCYPDAPPHPFLGRVIYTQDPGRAMQTGKCADVGAIGVQQLRGLAARAPYFSNGSARTLGEVVDFYDRRFRIGFSSREKQDLVNFLGVL